MKTHLIFTLLLLIMSFTLCAENMSKQVLEYKQMGALPLVTTENNGNRSRFLVLNEPNQPTPPTVSNVIASQRQDGSGIIDISYLVFDLNGDESTISLFVSFDGGESFDYQPALENLSGDIGDNIPSGTNGRIVWDASAELNDIESDICGILIKAEDHTVYGTVATPLFNPPGGQYSEEQSVSITCATAEAVIYYTLDGSEPDEYSTLYTDPIQIASDTTIKAKAYKAYWLSSETGLAEYLIDPRFILVESGTFSNGTSNVTLASFYIDKYQLTQADYEAVMGTNPAYFTGNTERPVEQVSWFNAIEYCNRRSLQEGFTPCYSYGSYGTNSSNWPSGWNGNYQNHTNVGCDWAANGYRLPTEMEWMFAAKGGNQSQGYSYSGSNNIDEVAWYYNNSYNMGSNHPDYGTHTVGTKLPNELGIYDMSGNVWEWCWDIYGSYLSGAQSNPHGATSGSYRVTRGGSWNYNASGCTVSFRLSNNATISYDVIGFRCVRVSP